MIATFDQRGIRYAIIGGIATSELESLMASNDPRRVKLELWLGRVGRGHQ